LGQFSVEAVMTNTLVACMLLTMALGVQEKQSSSVAVELHWLDHSSPQVPVGVSWGVPWPRGAVKRETDFQLMDGKGNQLPLQSWPMAFWPDGSLKWTGHSLSTAGQLVEPLTIRAGKPVLPDKRLEVSQTADFIQVTAGGATWQLPKKGAFLVDSVVMGNTLIAKQGRLVCTLEDRSEYKTKRILREEDFISQVTAATLEQSGSVRAVIKMEGKHKSESSDRSWLPFTVRLYFYAGVDSVKMVHSVVFDGDHQKDFIRGLGVRFDVPMREQVHNRHVRLAGDTGLFAEPVRPIAGRGPPSADLYAKQIAGKLIPNLEKLPGKNNVAMLAVWDDFKLVQHSADSFSIHKRTGDHSAWIDSVSGRRSPGMAFVGDATGGLTVGMRNFWQLHPTALEIHKASTEQAEVTVWLWSPDAPAMDMRHYDVKEHGLDASYEDVQPGFSTPYGVARTTELILKPSLQTPPSSELWEQAKANSQPPRLVCTPGYYHAVGIFGIWSLPDRSTAGKKWIEDQLDRGIAFYQG
jgi:YetA-like protein